MFGPIPHLLTFRRRLHPSGGAFRSALCSPDTALFRLIVGRFGTRSLWTFRAIPRFRDTRGQQCHFAINAALAAGARFHRGTVLRRMDVPLPGRRYHAAGFVPIMLALRPFQTWPGMALHTIPDCPYHGAQRQAPGYRYPDARAIARFPCFRLCSGGNTYPRICVPTVTLAALAANLRGKHSRLDCRVKRPSQSLVRIRRPRIGRGLPPGPGRASVRASDRRGLSTYRLPSATRTDRAARGCPPPTSRLVPSHGFTPVTRTA